MMLKTYWELNTNLQGGNFPRQQDLVLMLDYSYLAKSTLADNYMSVILKKEDKFDTSKIHAVWLIFLQRFWWVLCLNIKAVFQLNIPTEFSSEFSSEFSTEYFKWIHSWRVLSNWKQPSLYAAAEGATYIGQYDSLRKLIFPFV